MMFVPLTWDNPNQRHQDIKLAREKLGWNLTRSLESNLKMTIAYFKNSFA
jgi:UDP-glucuronate decarboxylase